jgi:heme/copper-type cytochrome/quinol oxidase subunit 2
MSLVVEMVDRRRITDLVAVLIILAVGFGVGFGVASFLPKSYSVSPIQNSQPTQSPQVVYLAVVPDYGGPGWDAFVPLKYLGEPITAKENQSIIDNNITVKAGVPVKFVIINIDTMNAMNFSGTVNVPFTIYNDTPNGQIAVTYNQGQQIENLSIGHTFTVPKLGINIPIPPDTVVSFTYTFNTPGTYEYLCITPCGPGMGQVGYMVGYIIVQ